MEQSTFKEYIDPFTKSRNQEAEELCSYSTGSHFFSNRLSQEKGWLAALAAACEFVAIGEFFKARVGLPVTSP